MVVTPLEISPGLLGDLTFAAVGPRFVPAGPLPDVEGAFSLVTLRRGTHLHVPAPACVRASLALCGRIAGPF